MPKLCCVPVTAQGHVRKNEQVQTMCQKVLNSLSMNLFTP